MFDKEAISAGNASIERHLWIIAQREVETRNNLISALQDMVKLAKLRSLPFQHDLDRYESILKEARK